LFIAYSIGDKPAIASTVLLGVITAINNGGIISIVLAGFLCGSISCLIRNMLKVPRIVQGVFYTLVNPFITLVIALIIYKFTVIILLNNIHIFFDINNMNIYIRVVIGIILGLLVAYDMGGRINKFAYIIGIISISYVGQSSIMAAIIAAGVVSPLAVGISTLILKNSTIKNYKKYGKEAIIKGIIFITEGAIPFVTQDRKVYFPSVMIGSALTGGLSMLFNSMTSCPQGGIILLFIPGILKNPLGFLGSIFIGILVTILCIINLKLKYKKKC
jgi:PTS system fructose-specific IIC component